MRMFAFLVLALVGGGCASENKVTEEDRTLLVYNQDAWLMVANLMPPIVKMMPEHGAALELIVGKYGLPISAQMLSNWKPPSKKPAPISEETVKKAIAASDTSHKVGWLEGILGGTLIVLGIVAKWGGRLARFIPGIGQWISLSESFATGVERFIQDRKEVGDMEAVNRVVTYMSAEVATKPQLQPLVDKTLAAVKKKLGVDGTENLSAPVPEPDPAAPTPAPPPAG